MTSNKPNWAHVLVHMSENMSNKAPKSIIRPKETQMSQGVGLVSSGASLASWGEGGPLALVGHPSIDGITIKMPYGVDALHRPALEPIFSNWVG